MRLVKGVGLLCLLAACVLALGACEKQSSRAQAAAAAEAPPPAATQPEARDVALYDRAVTPLATEQCGQCHFPVFDAIRDEGGKHRIECVRCHETYHAYNPRKQNYADIMPKCDACHPGTGGGTFHGAEASVQECLECHEDPHRPLVMPFSRLTTDCAVCHKPVAGELAANPSAHATSIGCDDCHADAHGTIPQCADCHESHSPEVEMTSADCMTCHPVHKPTRISYAEDTSSAICAGCHGGVQEALHKTLTKHTDVPCAECHHEHGEIAPCSKCHGEPHSKALMQDTSKCGTCHGHAHELIAG